MSTEVPCLTIALLDFNAERNGLPTYSELAEALRNTTSRLRIAIDQDRHKLLDAVAEREANALLSRIPS